MTKSNYAACNSLLQAVKRTLRSTKPRLQRPTQSRLWQNMTPIARFKPATYALEALKMRLNNTRNNGFKMLAVNRGMVMGDVKLLEKSGGKSGEWKAS